MRRGFLWLFLVLTILGVPAKARPAPKGDTLAEADGVPIRAEEVEKALAPALAKLQEKLYYLRREQLDALIDERLLIEEELARLSHRSANAQ